MAKDHSRGRLCHTSNFADSGCGFHEMCLPEIGEEGIRDYVPGKRVWHSRPRLWSSDCLGLSATYWLVAPSNE